MFHQNLLWEVIVVDNASTDDTSQVARRFWPGKAAAPLRVVHEPSPGLIYARYRGLREANYNFVSFIDDDNWVASNWVRLVAEIMDSHRDIGACGGITEAVFEADPPFWFERFQNNYAVGAQGRNHGDATECPDHLWGAGLTLRKTVWKKLNRGGFQPLLSGRKGKSLSSGEDYERCYALQLAGWRLWYEPRLVLRHFMPDDRLSWHYLRRLYRSHGATRVGFEPYEFAMRISPNQLVKIANRFWIWQAIKTFGKLVVWHGWDWARSMCCDTEGDAGILGGEYQLGRLIEILRKRQEYDSAILSVWNADWRNTGCNNE